MQPAFTLILRVLVTIQALAAAAGQLSYIDALAGRGLELGGQVGPALLTLVTAHALVSLFAGVLAVVLAWRPIRKSPASVPLAVALGAWSYLLAYPGIVLLLRPDPGLTRGVFEAHFLLVEAFGLAGFVRFTTMFPRPLGRQDLTAASALPFWIRPAQGIRTWLVGPSAPWLAAFAVVALVLWFGSMTRRPLADAGLDPGMNLVRLAAAAIVVANLRRSWLSGSGDARHRLTWLVVGLSLLLASIAVLIGGNILMVVTGWPEPAVAWRPILLDLGIIGFIAGLSAGLLSAGSRDPTALTRRIVSLSTLVLLGLFLATALEALLSSALVGRISLPRGTGTVIALATMGSTFGRFLRFIERLFDQAIDSAAGEPDAV